MVYIAMYHHNYNTRIFTKIFTAFEITALTSLSHNYKYVHLEFLLFRPYDIPIRVLGQSA